MIPKKTLAPALAATLLCIGAPALAQGTGWYLGAGLGYSNASTDYAELGLNSGSVDGGSTTLAITTGVELGRYFGLELAYYDLGKVKFDGTAGAANVPVSGSAKAKAYGLSAVASYPVTAQFSPYARIGFGRSKVAGNANTENLTASRGDWRSETLYAVGFNFKVDPQWSFFGEWVKADDIRVDTYLVGSRVYF
jgi:opacity protein-like surface antigen